jgi:hypothetical protein
MSSVLDEVRSLVAARRGGRAQAIAEELRGDPETESLGRLAAGIVAYRRGFLELAWAELEGADGWERLAPAEFLRSGLVVAPQAALRAARELIADPPELPAESWRDLVTALFGYGAHDLAREAAARRPDAVAELSPWLAADPDAAAPAAGRPVLAVMDYGHPEPGRASANIGDHIQSIASLAHVVRHQRVRLHGTSELTGLLATLRERTRPELRRDDLDADLEVMTVHRDASMYQAIPEGTFVLCFGWYMHALFELRHGFPLHRSLRPIFVSFHCNKRELLTAEAIEYLKVHGPVGCRDWTTVYLLASAGVPAFFTGCITSTIGAVFPDAPAPPPDAPVAYVDTPGEGVAYAHSSPEVRDRSFTANVAVALDRLDTYRREHARVVTSRLHCHLPLRSIGVETEFRPDNPADPRFDGLIGIGDEAFAQMRSGLDDKLEQLLRALIAGGDVHARWREITADDAAAAERRRRRPPRLSAAHPAWPERITQAVDGTATHTGRAVAGDGATVHCAVVLAQERRRGLAALLDSLAMHASRPLHVWVLPLDGKDDGSGLAARFPELTLSWVRLDPLGQRGAALGRLLLPRLIPDVERVVVLPSASVATADVAELADLDLGAHVLAAPLRHRAADSSGYGVLNTAAKRLRERPALAAELRRTALLRHPFDYDAFDPAVLVLDLERMRRGGLVEEGLSLARTFALKDAEILHLLIGPDRAEVPARWAAVPTRTPERGPGLRHWADRVKPWWDLPTRERDLWWRHAIAT